MRWFLLGTLLVSCAPGTRVALDPPKTILFEVRFVNQAKRFVQQGWFVDEKGGVFRYDISDKGPLKGPEPEYLRDALAGLTEKVAQLEPKEFDAMLKLIPESKKGFVTQPVQRCFDYGTYWFYAYQYDENLDKHEPVLLYQAGDHARRNEAQAAATLTQWLRTFHPSLQKISCEP